MKNDTIIRSRLKSSFPFLSGKDLARLSINPEIVINKIRDHSECTPEEIISKINEIIKEARKHEYWSNLRN